MAPKRAIVRNLTAVGRFICAKRWACVSLVCSTRWRRRQRTFCWWHHAIFQDRPTLWTQKSIPQTMSARGEQPGHKSAMLPLSSNWQQRQWWYHHTHLLEMQETGIPHSNLHHRQEQSTTASKNPYPQDQCGQGANLKQRIMSMTGGHSWARECTIRHSKSQQQSLRHSCNDKVASKWSASRKKFLWIILERTLICRSIFNIKKWV